MKHGILIPTGGIGLGKDGGWIPKGSGLLRIQAAVRSCDPDSVVMVIGGKRSEGPSEARVHHAVLVKELEAAGVRPLGTAYDDQAYLTNRDLWRYAKSGKMDADLGISQSERGETLIKVVAYKGFYGRIAVILHALGYTKTEWIDSGESNSYPPLKEGLLMAITRIDPFFLWLGLPIVWLANRERS